MEERLEITIFHTNLIGHSSAICRTEREIRGVRPMRWEISEFTELQQLLVVLPFVEHLVVHVVQIYISEIPSSSSSLSLYPYFRILHCLHFLHRQHKTINITSTTNATRTTTTIIQTRALPLKKKEIISRMSSLNPTEVVHHLPLKCTSAFKHVFSRSNETVSFLISSSFNDLHIIIHLPTHVRHCTSDSLQSELTIASGLYSMHFLSVLQ